MKGKVGRPPTNADTRMARLENEDAEKLRYIASVRDITIAQAFRRYFGESLDREYQRAKTQATELGGES